MKRWLGLKDLIVDTVIAVDDLATDATRGTVGTVTGALRLAPSLDPVANVVDGAAHIGLSAHSALLRGITRAVGGGIGLGVQLAHDKSEPMVSDDRHPTPLRSDVVGSLPWIRDAALGAVNGVAGDYLSERGNGLALEMSFRHDGARLTTTSESLTQALPHATGRIALFVHGLATTDWSWSWEAESRHGDAAVNYGTRLQADSGFTPIYLRYNTGRHISENGKELAERLSELVAAWPVPVESVVLIGHSMGGLVSRSACFYADQHNASWLPRLEHVCCIGSPHHGAALEKLGNVLSVGLRHLPGTAPRIIRRVLDRRSVGIQDLRFGYIRHDEWKAQDPDALLDNQRLKTPPLPGVNYTFISGALGATPDHWISRTIGDLLVRIPSARGIPGGTCHHIDAANHVQLANDPRVYDHLANQVGMPTT